MNMKKTGRIVRRLAVLAAAVLLAACAGGSADAENTQASGVNECFLEFLPVERIAVGEVNGDTVIYAGYEKIEGISIFYKTEDEQEIERILAMFDGWDMEKNRVGEHDILDLGGDFYVRFNDIWYFEYGAKVDGKYYGFIRGIPYYFPEAFGAFMEELCASGGE